MSVFYSLIIKGVLGSKIGSVHNYYAATSITGVVGVILFPFSSYLGPIHTYKSLCVKVSVGQYPSADTTRLSSGSG